MTVLITLTTAGTDSGPFNLYTELDGFITPFETGVSKASLTGGYTSSLVPDYATIIRVKSTGDCVNYIDIILVGTTTTTTTATPITTTTTTSTVVPCYESIDITCTDAGTFDYTDCLGNPVSFGISPGTQTLNFLPNCFTFNTQGGSAMYTIDAYGPNC